MLHGLQFVRESGERTLRGNAQLFPGVADRFFQTRFFDGVSQSVGKSPATASVIRNVNPVIHGHIRRQEAMVPWNAGWGYIDSPYGTPGIAIA
jgi:hypothetical protein